MIEGAAFLSMFIDHLGLVLFPHLEILRFAGRLAMPAFIFMAVHGLRRTKDVDQYLERLFIFALVSQVPYFCMVQKMEWNMVFSIYATVSICELARRGSGIRAGLWFGLFAFIPSDYKIIAPALGLIYLYFWEDYPSICILSFMALFLYVLILPPVEQKVIGITYTAFQADKMNTVLSVFAVCFMHQLMKVKTWARSIRFPRWFKYSFYPVHISALLFIRYLIN